MIADSRRMSKTFKTMNQLLYKMAKFTSVTNVVKHSLPCRAWMPITNITQASIHTSVTSVVQVSSRKVTTKIICEDTMAEGTRATTAVNCSRAQPDWNTIWPNTPENISLHVKYVPKGFMKTNPSSNKKHATYKIFCKYCNDKLQMFVHRYLVLCKGQKLLHN